MARVLSLLGADLPRDLMPPADHDNPHGFWEPNRVVHAHDEMLAAAGSSWDDFLPLPINWHKISAAQSHLRRIESLLKEEFGDSALFVLKDPRICRCVPTWIEVLERLGVACHFVFTLRNPLEVAASLQARNGFPPSKSLAIWLRSVLDAEFSTRDYPRTFVSYEHLLRDWPAVAAKIGSDLKISWPRCQYQAGLDIEEFLSAAERHHAIDDEELAQSSASNWAKRAYFALQGMIEGPEEPCRAVLDAVRCEVGAAEQAYGVIFADYRAKSQSLHKELEQVRAQGAEGRAEAAREMEHLRQQAAADLARARQELEQLRPQIGHARAEVQRIEAELAAARQAGEERDARLAELGQTIAARVAENEEQRAEIAACREALARGVQENAAQRDEIAACRAALARGVQENAALRDELAEGRVALASLRAEEEGLHRERFMLQTELEECRRRIEVLQAERARADEALGQRASEVAELGKRLAARESEVDRLASRNARLRREILQNSERLAARDKELNEQKRHGGRLQQELEARDVGLARQRARVSEHELCYRDSLLARWNTSAAFLGEESRAARAALAQLNQATAGEPLGRLVKRAGRRLVARTRLIARRRRLAQRARLVGSGLFDIAYYLARNPDLTSPGLDPVDHFLACGAREGRRPCALFDPAWYLRIYQDVAVSGMNPLEHYLLYGTAEGRKPHPLFDTVYYLRENPDVAQSGQNPLGHYLQVGAEEGRKPHPLFDTAYYLRENPEVGILGLNPLAHYIDQGAAEGRNPNPLFDGVYYLRENPHVAAAGINPLQHFIENGARERRNPNPLFDVAYYLTENPDVAALGMNPLAHYLECGGAERRRPSLLFDVDQYLDEHPEAAGPRCNPLAHYLECSRHSGSSGAISGADHREEAAGKVAFSEVTAPRVSIIVPAHNGWPTTARCLRAIRANTSVNLPYEVILADDGSDDQTCLAGETVANLEVVRTRPEDDSARLGPVGACNQAAARARGEFLVFLRPNVQVQPGWLTALLEAADRDPAAGIVGPKIVQPNGLLKEAGRIVWDDASDSRYGAGHDPSRPEYSYLRQTDYVASDAVLVRRRVWEELGGFDEEYAAGGYEGADLAFRCRQRGGRVLYQPKSVVVQPEEKVPVASGDDPERLAPRLRFEQKWSAVLGEEHLPRNMHPFLAHNHGRKAQHLLYCDWDLPAADRDSGSFRACNLMQILQEMGYRLTLLPANLYPAQPQLDRLRQAGIFAACGGGIKSLEAFFAQYGGYFDAVIVSRVNVAEACMELVRKHCRKAFVVFDTTDLHFLREQREAELANDDALRVQAAATRKKELGFIHQADVTLVVSPVEKELLRKEAPGSRVEIVSNIHPVPGCARPMSERQDMLFIGGFNHRPNPDAVKWLAKEIFPRIHQRLPEARMFIIGSNPPVDVLALNTEHFRVLGYVADVEPYFGRCRLSVVPLRYGAGVKGKINMSMSYGVPVVATSVGCEGMFLTDGEDVLVADDAETFADAVCRLYADEALWGRLSAAGLKNVEERFSFEAARRALRDIFPQSGPLLARAA